MQKEEKEEPSTQLCSQKFEHMWKELINKLWKKGKKQKIVKMLKRPSLVHDGRKTKFAFVTKFDFHLANVDVCSNKKKHVKI